MKHYLRFLLLLTLLLSLLALSACRGNDGDGQGTGDGDGTGEGEGSGGGETVSYDITFIVEGVKTVVSTKEGEIPAFDGTPEKPSTEIFEYVFDGWDKELSPANGAATYTAIFKEQLRTYTVTFRVDGEVYATNKVRFGKPASLPEGKDLPTKEGLSFFGWTNETSSVQSDITCDAMFAWGDAASLEWAYNYRLIKYINLYDGENYTNNSTGAFLYLALSEFNHDNPLIRERVLQHIRSFTTGGQECGFTAGPFWYYATNALGIMMVRYTPAVWNELTEVEKEKLDFIMECYSVATAFVSDDQNNFKTGVSLTGNHGKGWNPNHRMAMTFPIVAATVYFSHGDKDGAAYVNDIFLNFDYDRFINKFDEYGFTRAKFNWTTEGYIFEDGTQAPGAKELLINGGDAYCVRVDNSGKNNGHVLGQSYGSGIGIKGNEFSYYGIPLTDLKGIIEHMYNYNYSGGAVVSDSSSMKNGVDENGKPLAYILDNTKSPVEGEIGMMKEFMASDGGGIRSTTTYCTHDFILVVESIAALTALDAYEVDLESELFRRILIGNTDVIYKYAHGYHGYSLGKGYDHKEPATASNYTPWKTYWLANYANAIPITRLISYDTFGGECEGLVTSFIFDEDNEQTVVLPTPTHPAGSFTAWCFDAEGTLSEYDGLKIADGKLIIPKGYSRRIDLYAVYKYADGVGIGDVYYHLPDNVKLSGKYDIHYFDIGEDYTVRLPALDKEQGYVLIGWYLESGCEGEGYTSSYTVSASDAQALEELHFYAAVYKDLYTQSATDGLDSAGFPTSKKVMINGELVPSLQQVVMPDGSVILTKYADGDTSNTNGDGYWRYSGIKMNTATLTFDVTLYKEPGVDIAGSGIRLRNASNVEDFLAISSQGTVKFTDGTLIGQITEKPTRFTFLFFGRVDADGKPLGGFDVEAYVDGVYKASFSYSATIKGKTEQLTYEEVTILHWYHSITSSGSLHVKDLTITDGIAFEPKLSIEYELGVGEGEGFVNAYDKTKTEQTVTLPTLTHEVAEFGGWFLDPDFTVTENDYLSIEGNILTIAAGYGEEIKLYAKMTYPENLGVGNIVYNTPSGVTLEGDYDAVYYDVGKAFTVALPKIKAPDGYEVIGWYLDAANKGICYQSGGSITLSAETVALRAPINLYPAIRKQIYSQDGLLHEASMSSTNKPVPVEGGTAPSMSQKLDSDGSALVTKINNPSDSKDKNADGYWRYNGVTVNSGALTLSMTLYKDAELDLVPFQIRLRGSANTNNFLEVTSTGDVKFVGSSVITNIASSTPRNISFVFYANYDEDGRIATGFKVDAYVDGEYAASYDYVVKASSTGEKIGANEVESVHIYFSPASKGSVHVKDLTITDGAVIPAAE